MADSNHTEAQGVFGKEVNVRGSRRHTLMALGPCRVWRKRISSVVGWPGWPFNRIADTINTNSMANTADDGC